ncbi:MAG: hypothetical protein WD595_02205 [Waddliaceae bacterium]
MSLHMNNIINNVMTIPKDLSSPEKTAKERGMLKLGATVLSVSVIALTALTIAAALSNPITATALAILTIAAFVFAHDTHKVAKNMESPASSSTVSEGAQGALQKLKAGYRKLLSEDEGDSRPEALNYLDGTWVLRHLFTSENS